jgi:MerR family transcriptional regulator, light-induced transcriptional regulator
MSYNQSPVFNLKAVIKETGIAADTLRAWERRYGLPLPERTPGGHRLYSEYDIETIKWLINKQEDGLSISRAVDLWKETRDSGEDPLADLQPAFISEFPAVNIENARQAWIQSCLAFDEFKADQILNQAFAAYSVEIVCMEVLRRGLFDIGELWYQGKASVQQEHFASGLASRKLDTLINAAPAPTRRESILLACPPEEQHVFPLLFLTLFLRRRGWNVVNLGSNVPIAQMEEAADKIQAVLVVMSAQQLTTAIGLRAMAVLLQQKEVQLAFGGRIFNLEADLQDRIPGHFLGTTIETSLQAIETLALHPEPVPIQKPLHAKEIALSEAFIQNRRSIEDFVINTLPEGIISTTHLATANSFLGDTLSAALQLGNPSYLNSDMDWLRTLLTPREIPFTALPEYLEVYEKGIEKTLGKTGATLVQWVQLYRQKITTGVVT